MFEMEIKVLATRTPSEGMLQEVRVVQLVAQSEQYKKWALRRLTTVKRDD